MVSSGRKKGRQGLDGRFIVTRRKNQRTRKDYRMTKLLSKDQIAVDSAPSFAVFHIETPIDTTLRVTIRHSQDTVRAEWLLWNDVKQDWIGVRVPWSDVKHLVPEMIVFIVGLIVAGVDTY